MRRCYIAGPVTGLQLSEVETAFAAAKTRVRELGYEPVSPIELTQASEWEQCMITAVKGMLDCEAVYALKNWKASKGATIEVQLALRLGLTVLFEATSL